MDWSRLNVNFYRNKETSVIMSEVADRETIVKVYEKFQRLRLFINAKNVWFTPQFGDLFGFLVEKIRERFVRFFGRTKALPGRK